MNDALTKLIQNATGASRVYPLDFIQSLWSGYGRIMRYGLEGAEVDRVVVKQIHLNDSGSHPRGWNSDLSHQRKLRSYEIEAEWYANWSSACSDSCRVPHCLAHWAGENERLLVLEDLDAAGFSQRKTQLKWTQMSVCLQWLAYFHATFLHTEPAGLWPVGTYWHLATRPDELAVLTDQKLKQAAPVIDQILTETPFKTFVHGDAKLANFCFSQDAAKVAAVDFQYVGGGCGMKDVAYFIGSCLDEADCERYEQPLLDVYFEALQAAVKARNPQIDYPALEQNWRDLFPLAWTDFHRFLKGWSPGHWKINSYSERMARQVLDALQHEGRL
jgi:thiamine kinase-like enzyme